MDYTYIKNNKIYLLAEELPSIMGEFARLFNRGLSFTEIRIRLGVRPLELVKIATYCGIKTLTKPYRFIRVVE